MNDRSPISGGDAREKIEITEEMIRAEIKHGTIAFQRAAIDRRRVLPPQRKAVLVLEGPWLVRGCSPHVAVGHYGEGLKPAVTSLDGKDRDRRQSLAADPSHARHKTIRPRGRSDRSLISAIPFLT